MRRIAFSMLALVAVVGCSDPSAQDGAGRELTAAIRAVDDAAVGFGAGDGNASSSDRQALLTSAASKLDAVARSGSDTQKLGALQLQADTAAYAASRSMTEAARNAAKLESGTLVMLTDIEIITEIEGRIARLRVSEDNLLTQLQEGVEGVPSSGLDVVGATIDELSTTEADLRARVATHQKAVDDLESKLDELRAQAQKLRADAFAADGEKKADLQFQTGAVDRQIEATESSLNKANAELGAVAAELKLTDMRMASQRQVADELSALVKTVEDRTTQRESDLDEQIALRDQEVAELLEAVRTHVGQFDSSVSVPFDSAATQLAEAIKKVESARGVGSLIPQTSVRLDVLGKRVLLAEIHSRHATALAGLVQTIDVLNTNLSDDTQAGQQMTQIVEPLRTELDRVIGDTNAAVDDGMRLANELDTQITEGDASKRSVQNLIVSLDAAKARALSATQFVESR